MTTEAGTSNPRQTALIVWQNGNDNNVGELNNLLGDGWRLVSLNRISQQCHATIAALAILEKAAGNAVREN